MSTPPPLEGDHPSSSNDSRRCIPDALDAALRRLAADARAAWILHEVSGMSSANVAKVLGQTEAEALQLTARACDTVEESDS